MQSKTQNATSPAATSPAATAPDAPAATTAAPAPAATAPAAPAATTAAPAPGTTSPAVTSPAAPAATGAATRIAALVIFWRQISSLFVANLRIALRYLLVLVLASLALVALILASLPRELFVSADIPKVSIALAYGNDDSLSRNLSAELAQVEVIENFFLCGNDEADRLLGEGQVDAAVILPDALFDNLVSGNRTTITVKATDPLLGSVVFAVVERAAQTMNSLQSYTLIYSDAALAHFGSGSEAWDAINNFTLRLLGDALSRLSSVQQLSAVSPYYLQVLTFLLFVLASSAALFCAVTLAQYNSGGFSRRLHLRRAPFASLCIASAASGILLAAILTLVCGIALKIVDSAFNIGFFVVSGIFLSLIMTPLFALVAFAKPGEDRARTRTLLASMAIMFLLLFAGGGFYPSYLTASPLRLLNPVWLSNLLSTWTLAGELDLGAVALFVVLPVICVAAWSLEWRLSK